MDEETHYAYQRFQFIAYSLFTISIGRILYNSNMGSKILQYVFHTPGVGMVKAAKKGKKMKVYTKTEIGDMLVQFYKTPNYNIDVGFFTDDVKSVIRPEDIDFMIDRKIFTDRYKEFIRHQFPSFKNGILTDLVKRSDYTTSDVIYGYVDSLIDDKVFIFSIRDKFIDYEKIFDDYENILDKIDGDNLLEVIPEENFFAEDSILETKSVVE